MSALHDRSNPPGDEAAMALVLAAERDARADIETASREAAATLDAARTRARTIDATAARRAAAVRATLQARLGARLVEVEALEREALAHDGPDPGERLRLERAAERCARELGGEEP